MPATGARGCQPKGLTGPSAIQCLRTSTMETQLAHVRTPSVDLNPDSWRGGAGLSLCVIHVFSEGSGCYQRRCSLC